MQNPGKAPCVLHPVIDRAIATRAVDMRTLTTAVGRRAVEFSLIASAHEACRSGPDRLDVRGSVQRIDRDVARRPRPVAAALIHPGARQHVAVLFGQPRDFAQVIRPALHRPHFHPAFGMCHILV